ncbi:MAG: hypothetical protein GY737_29745 [Desulfobacteraceae bacterium]|nr:hypothetical protein [Desulfobacteraceae bacterium]
MKKKCIGIIGGYGQGGLEAAKTLLELTDYEIMIGGRDLEKAEAAACDLGPRAIAGQVDVWREPSLDRFCRQCRLVVNCAGPSRRILDTVALRALAAGIHYMDMGGDDVLYDRLVPLQESIGKKGLGFITSTGTYPGLSGLFPAYTADRYCDRVDSLILYFVNQGDVLTQNAAYDVVCSLEDEYAQGMSKYENGRITRTGTVPVMASLPFFQESVLMYPSFTRELKLLAESLEIPSAQNYFAFSENAMETLFAIHSNRAYVTEEGKKKAADELVKASRRDAAGKKKRTLYHLVMEGAFRETPRKITSSLLFEGDSSRLMGMVTGILASLVLRSSGKPGSHFMFDAVPGRDFMQVLSKYGITPVENIEEQILMDSGVII